MTDYRQILAFGGDEQVREPDPWERRLGDFLDPHRTGRITTVVNTCCREAGYDVDGWTLPRLLNMLAQAHREAESQRDAMQG